MLKLLSDMPFPGAPHAELQRQPAGFDLTVALVSKFTGPAALGFDNQLRELPACQALAWDPSPARTEQAQLPPAVGLEPGAYLVTYNEVVAVPADCAGLVLPRSSLMRCGAMLHSALWDPGYSGRGQGLLTVFNNLRLYRDARIGQFVLIDLESAATDLYSGRYQGENT
jgi:dUTP pyrophosphatase